MKNTRAELSPEQVEWLRKVYNERMHPKEIAAVLGYHIDTVKRLLDRYGISAALSAKHMTAPVIRRDLWCRPCMRCKDDAPRPKNQYICDRCTKIHSMSGHADDYLLS